ncbi:MAG: transcription-repair coupling factor [Candidatus Omnitrophota bacterium]|nr:MAG: transcription-repair coupling factor [Candidatus Omnitrophota bacterium]
MFKIIKLYPEQCINLEKLIQQFIDFNYQHTQQVSQKGDFARRGAIIDLYAINYEHPARIELNFDKIERIFTFDLSNKNLITLQSPMIILPFNIAAPHKLQSQRLFINESDALENGDFVVHIEHGIGKYIGKIKLNKKIHIKIEYAHKDNLYIPIKQKYLLQKYISFSKHTPKLHKLGGKLWKKTKEQAEKGINNFAFEMLKLQAKRNALTGFACAADTDWQKIFEKSFPYKETPDQKKTISQVKKDMEAARPMDRLICGDVGYGKTEVAFRAAFKTVVNNEQAAILVPTTILAQQHYHNLSKRLKNFPINLQMLSRFKTNAEQKNIIEGLKTATVDIVIGTHRLLSDDIKFKNLGLIIIDEEQRFGVNAKEKLKKIKELVDVLTLTATPIPRTLYMSLLGIKDISTINTPPGERLPIETFVCAYDEELIKNALNNELERNGQVYFIHNRIKDLKNIHMRIQNLMPEAKIAIGHGQMSEKNLEKIMLDFIQHKIDILISTTIVESGLDIPNVNTLIVNHAQNFGLADLYQLRGRVGRFKRKAYAYFFTPKHTTFNPIAKMRLQTIKKFTQLGAGFKIAMQDLEIRGAGNILGKQQHGYITAIGFDLYCQMLKHATHLNIS